MDLKTTYLGFELKHPLMLGASPLAQDLDQVKRAEDAGVSAFVMHSLFEEQITSDRAALDDLSSHGESSAEAQSYLPAASEYLFGPEAYLEHLRKVKAAVSVPVIGSLNGSTASGWLDYAKLIQQAGADAIELNVYTVGSDPKESGSVVEQRIVDMVKAVVTQTQIPISVKLSPFNTALSHFAGQLEQAGAKGLVLFNRFYQPDIDINELEVALKLELSTPAELLLRLRWLALLSGRLNLSLGVSGGVHSSADVLKATMAGAHAVQLVSVLLKRGIQALAELTQELTQWLEEHEYQSLGQALGSMNLSRSPNPSMYERGNYIRILQGYARSLRQS
ncbi:dihydroorotate dehydrogenase-like protein [Myxococcota bacterium]